MKKILSVLLFAMFISSSGALAFSPTYSNPTEGTINFYPMMRRQMEHEETLDFDNDPEHYKEKRNKKDAQDAYRAGNKNFNPSYEPSTSLIKFMHKNQDMQFTTDSNGNILIKNSDK